MRWLLFFFLFINSAYSEDLSLDNLLQEYANKQELYNFTQKEGAGHSIIFSRFDLDSMQAHTLNDVLKTLRFFTLQTRNNGLTTLAHGGSSQMSNFPVKIFINSHELNSATLGNALVQYGKMGLYFIDHIEVYQSANSIMFGNEPGSMIIRLYTKEPSRENGASVQMVADSRGGKSFQIVDAREFGEYSYLANLDIKENNFKNYNINSYELSRDGYRGQLFLKFSKKKSYDIELGASNEKHDIFGGLGAAPLEGYSNNRDIYLQYTKFFDNDIEVRASISYEEMKLSNEDALGITLSDLSVVSKLDFDIYTEVYDVLAQKKFRFDDNELLVGAQFRHQKFTVDEFKADNAEKAMNWGPGGLNTYMLYIEDIYNINKDHFITLSAKLDTYRDSLSKSSTETLLRAGYVGALNDALSIKTFVTKSYIYPIFLQKTFFPTMNTNPYLKASDVLMLSGEVNYTMNRLKLGIGVGTNEVKDPVVYNHITREYVNSPQNSRFDIFFANVEYAFDPANKLKAEFFTIDKDGDFSPKEGGSFQLFNTLGKLNVYNELIYRCSYTSVTGLGVSSGYDYTVGVNYRLNKQTELKLKGENLLNRASGVMFGQVNIPTIERKAIVSLEYVF